MDKQARIERISLMEDRYDEVTRVLGELDEAGQLPSDLKRGVLSQDGLYVLLQDATRSSVTPLPTATISSPRAKGSSVRS